MEEGLGHGIVAPVGELSQEEEGELGLQSLGLQRKSVRIWSQRTPVPPFSVRSLELEMLKGER